MIKKLIIYITLFSSLLMAKSSYYSQNGFGLGGDVISVRSQGLGNSGGAILDSISLTSENPAFWYNFQTTSLQGLLYYSNQSTGKMDENFRSSSLGGFAMKFPIGEFIGVALGLKPEYRADYETVNMHNQPFDGDTIQFYNESSNKGGISEAFLGFGYKFGSRLSLGAKTKVLFGNYNFKNSTDKLDNGSIDTYYSEKLKMTGFQTEFGLGWNQKNNFTFGLSYSLHHNFQYRSLYNYYWGADSSTKNQDVQMPSKFTISLQKKIIKQLYFTSDFYYLQDYSDLVEKSNFFDEIKSDKSYYAGFGLERVHGQRIEKQFWKNFNYRVGAFYKTEPFYKNSDQIKDIGLSVGIGIPMNFNMTQLDVAFQYIQRSGFLEDEIGKESIYKLSIGITTGGLWFRR